MAHPIPLQSPFSKGKSVVVKSLQSYTAIFLVFTFFLVGIRIYELVFGIYHNALQTKLTRILLAAFLKDFEFLFFVFLWNYLFYLLLFWLLGKKIADVVIIIVFTGILFIQLLLVRYFLTTLVPLGADFWAYSWKEITHTVAASGALRIISLVPIFLFTGLLFFSFKYLPQKLNIGYRLLLIFFCISLFINLMGVGKKMTSINLVKEEFGNNLTENKFLFFAKKSQQFFFPNKFDIDIYDDNYFENNKTAGIVAPFSFTDEASFPFLHEETTPNVLGPFFDATLTQPPNIVFILAEGLGRAFSNEKAYWGSFTPFLDSLSKKSLYWENCLSQGGRTFAVLPAVLGSLPFGSNGFLDLDKKMPNHFSLFNLLQQQNYNTGFYYGGNAAFDNMEQLLQKNNVNSIADEKTFPATYKKLPADETGFCWGIGDKELFRRFFETQKNEGSSYIDVLLTVSTHSPFRINDQEYYLKRFEERLSVLNFDENEKNEHRYYKYQGASILFLDDAIRYFFSEYTKRSDFARTIFIITGDHRMPEIPMSSKIDRYHVPLIIYSPMLKRTSTFSSIVTHNDIAPSLLAWMKKQYNFPIPSRTTWLSHGLDTNRSFRNMQPVAFMQTKNGISDFVFDQFFLNENSDLYSIDASMNLERSNDQVMKEKLKMLFSEFVEKNNAMMRSGVLLPDTLYRKYIVK